MPLRPEDSCTQEPSVHPGKILVFIVHSSLSSEPYVLKECTWLKVELGDVVELTKKVPLEHGIVKPHLDSEEIHVARLTGGAENSGRGLQLY